MRHYHVGLFALAIAACQPKQGKKAENMNTNEAWINIKAPQAEKIPKEMTIHGDKRIDDYYWLNERENPKVIAYLEAENKYRIRCLHPPPDYAKSCSMK
ncbi:hypothetical protein MKQ70_18840 [Chitinophaga sedimenti]|nr:hypothetical protein [Chitinophaga sedimenti]MCK7556959.1 hypothetical protein [Chitinophaga sedimenti]